MTALTVWKLLFHTDEANAQTRFGLNTTQQDAFRAALQSWSNVANLRFNELSETSTQVGDIRVAWTSAEYHLDDGSQAWGWAYYPGGWLNPMLGMCGSPLEARRRITILGQWVIIISRL